MSTPPLTIVTRSPASVVSSVGWNTTSGTVLAALQGGGGTLQADVDTYGSEILHFTVTSYTPPAGTYVYGVSFHFDALWVTDTRDRGASLPIEMQTPNGKMNIAVNMPYFGGSSTQDVVTDMIVRFDDPVSEWDLSTMNFRFDPTALKGLTQMLDFTVRIHTFTPSDLFPALPVLPPHTLTEDRWPEALAGGIAKPALYVNLWDYSASSFATVVPDVLEIRAADSAKAPGNATTDYGIRVPYRSDRGIIVAEHVTEVHLTTNRATGPVHCRGGWYLPATGGYIWSTWTTTDVAPVVGYPEKPDLAVALNGDKITVTAFSPDNLLPAIFTGMTGSVSTLTVDTLVTLGANVTKSWETAYDTTTQRADEVLRLTRTSSLGAIVATIQPVPVQAGKEYLFAGTLNCSVATNATTQAVWYDASGAVLATNTTWTGALGAGTSLEVYGIVEAPVNAVRVAWQVTTDAVASSSTLDIWHLVVGRQSTYANIQFRQGGYLWGNAAVGLGSGRAVTKLRHLEESGVTSSSIVSTAPRTGTYHLEVVTVGTTPTVLAMRNYAMQLPIDWPGDLPICARAWVRRATSTGFARIGLRFIDGNGNTISEAWGDRINATTTYAIATVEDVIVPAGTVLVDWLFGAETATASSFYVDDISIFFDDTLPSATFNTVSGGGGFAPYETPCAWIAIERQLPDQDWATVGIMRADPFVDSVFDDYLLPLNHDIKYRARTYGMQNGQLIEGPYSAEVTVTQASDSDRFVLWDPTEDLGPLYFDLSADNPTLDTVLLASMASYSPIGRDRRVVTTDVSKGRTFTLAVNSIDSAELALWENFHRTRRALVMQRPLTGDCWTVILTGDMTVQIKNTTPVTYLVMVKAEEIDVPPVW